MCGQPAAARSGRRRRTRAARPRSRRAASAWRAAVSRISTKCSRFSAIEMTEVSRSVQRTPPPSSTPRAPQVAHSTSRAAQHDDVEVAAAGTGPARRGTRRPRTRGRSASATLRPSCAARSSAPSSSTIDRGVPAPSNTTWSTTAICIENVSVCRTGSASVFHCGVSDPPTAMNPATRGLSTRSSTRNGTRRLAARPLSRDELLDDRGVGVRPEQAVAEQLEPRRRPCGR